MQSRQVGYVQSGIEVPEEEVYSSGSRDSRNRKAIFKITLLGDGGVGKSSLLNRFMTNKFEEDHKMTIGVDIETKEIKDIETYDLKTYDVDLQVWDLAGQERFKIPRAGFYRGSKGALLLFDVTNYESFEHLNEWYEEFGECSGYNPNEEYIPMIVIANKVDLKERRVVQSEEGHRWAYDKNLVYIETSAKTGENVENSFRNLTKFMADKMRFEELNPGDHWFPESLSILG